MAAGEIKVMQEEPHKVENGSISINQKISPQIAEVTTVESGAKVNLSQSTSTVSSPSEKKWQRRLQNFFIRNDVHGFPDLYEANGLLGKSFWFILLLVSVSMLTYELIQVITDFKNNPVLTSYRIVSQSNGIAFPSVYLCPTNPIHQPSYQRANVLDKWEKQHVNGFFKATANSSGLSSLLSQKINAGEALAVLMGTALRQDLGTKNDKQPWIPKSIQEYFMTVGIPMVTFLKECSFNSHNFNCSEHVTPVFDGSFGKCFLFKSGQFTQYLAGVGLSVVIDLDLDSTPVDKAALYDGVVLKVADPFDPTSQDSVLLAPGTYTKASLQVTKMHLIKTKEQPCVSTSKMNQHILKILDTDYTLSACRYDCLQQTIAANCFCYIALDERYFQNYRFKLCDSEELSRCAYPTIFTYPYNETISRCCQSCPVSCSITDHKVDLSWARFPSSVLMRQPSQSNGDPPAKKDTESLIRKVSAFQNSNRIILDIAFGSLQYVEMIQKPSMTFNTFVSNVGGQIGLWLGASIVTLVKSCLLLAQLAQSLVVGGENDITVTKF